MKRSTSMRVAAGLAAAALVGVVAWAGYFVVPAAAAPAHKRSVSSPATQAAPDPAPEAPWHPWLEPHPQKNLPPLVLPKFQLTRSKAEVRALYQFAAERPDVLNYVPCYCGCVRLGHHSNEQCFVKSRAKNGDVTAWNDHAMMCPMCLAIGERAMEMTRAGDSIRAIRASVKKTFGQAGPSTPTPAPPRRGGH